MGFYIEAKDNKNRPVAAIGYQVWNPNIKFLYQSLNMSGPGANDWSGDKEDVLFSHEEIGKAVVRVNNFAFNGGVEYEELHPLINMFAHLQQPEIDPQKEKERLQYFLNACLDVTKIEGQIIINFR